MKLERRVLAGKDLLRAERMMAIAVEQATLSGCLDSPRGVVFEKNGTVVSRGFNTPPEGYVCVPGICGGKMCGDYTVHAEMNAITAAAKSGAALRGARGYHIKFKDGEMIPAKEPSCYSCAKHMLHAGIDEFVLLEQEGGTLVHALYPIRLFTALSMKNDKRLLFDTDLFPQLSVYARKRP